MNVLYIAYSCMPNKGSEEKIGWNIPLASAKYNKVYVLTKEEHRSAIEAYLRENKVENIRFFYVDIPKVYKKLFRGVAYFGRLNIWHKRALPVAKQICETEKIDLIHQITPIEFRSIGDYGSIPGVKFVCGPVGGGEFLPKAFWKDVGKYSFVEYIRKLLNYRFRNTFRIQNKLAQCDYVFFANKETETFLAEFLDEIPHELYFDNGIDESELRATERVYIPGNHKIVFLVAGRLAYRKGHKFLLDVLAQLPDDLEYECRILGEGPEMEKLKSLCSQYGLENRVLFFGRIPFSDMKKEYENADVFIMPSIRETTGAVLLEAMAKGLPVVTINQFGGPVLLDSTTGWLHDGNTREEYMDSLRDNLMACAACPEEAHRRGQNAVEVAKRHLWNNKVDFYQKKYLEICGDAES